MMIMTGNFVVRDGAACGCRIYYPQGIWQYV